MDVGLKFVKQQVSSYLFFIIKSLITFPLKVIFYFTGHFLRLHISFLLFPVKQSFYKQFFSMKFSPDSKLHFILFRIFSKPEQKLHFMQNLIINFVQQVNLLYFCISLNNLQNSNYFSSTPYGAEILSLFQAAEAVFLTFT